MPTTLRLTAEEYCIVTDLTRNVPILTEPLISQAYYPGSKNPAQAAQQAMRRLEQKGLVQLQNVVIRQVAPSILWRWDIGDPEPPDEKLASLAYQLQNRWRKLPALSTSVIYPTRKAAHSFYGHHKEPRPADLMHDVALSAGYLQLRKTAPHIAQTWVLDTVLLARRRIAGEPLNEPLPDAMLIVNREFPMAIEQGGSSYTTDRLRDLVDWVIERNYSLEIW
jgi:hypothetical protein